MIRIVLVDDQPAFRRITHRLLSMHSEIVVVGEAGDGMEALDVVAQVRPDVVLMDLYMPILDGVAATRQIRAAYPDVQIILFTSVDQDGYVLEGVRAGASGYLLKTARTEMLVAAIQAAIDGRSDARGRQPG
ncbi:MAG TPA: response regulator transcription factor [Herpetosiphonaceae bacterium]